MKFNKVLIKKFIYILHINLFILLKVNGNYKYKLLVQFYIFLWKFYIFVRKFYIFVRKFYIFVSKFYIFLKNYTFSCIYSQISDVRQGKFFVLNLDGWNHDEAQRQLERISKEVLANPVIEEYRFEIVE